MQFFYETTGWSSFNRFFTLLFLEQSKCRTTKSRCSFCFSMIKTIFYPSENSIFISARIVVYKYH